MKLKTIIKTGAHILAGLSLFYGSWIIPGTIMGFVGSTLHMISVLTTIKFILLGIFFETVALNIK